jgi:hypothetical protein
MPGNLSQRPDVDFGIDLRRVLRLVAENLRDLAEGSAVLDHPACQAVTKKVRSTTRPPGYARTDHDLAYNVTDRGWARQWNAGCK